MPWRENFAVLAEHVKSIEEKIDYVRSDMAEQKKQLTEIVNSVHRWRGGFFAISGMGAFAASLAAFWDRIKLWTH